MSQIITYAFFGEDAAQRNFLEKYLNRQFPDTFIEDKAERWRFKATSGSQVDKLLPDALRQRAIMGLDILFIGRDVDTEHKPTIRTRQIHFEDRCKGHPTILMLPVQCIEYWLWYIKRQREEPGKKSPLEANPRLTAKQAGYAGTNVVANQLVIADNLLTDLDVSWLESRSDSFKHFHNQVKTFIAQTT